MTANSSTRFFSGESSLPIPIAWCIAKFRDARHFVLLGIFAALKEWFVLMTRSLRNGGRVRYCTLVVRLHVNIRAHKGDHFTLDGLKRSFYESRIVDPLLILLQENAALKPAQLAQMLNISESEVNSTIKRYEQEQIILGYRTILNEEKLGHDAVRAVIEVKITPEREGGFNRLAERIAKYSEVRSCYLMSGGYDLLVFVEGRNLREVASFVSEKLATIQGVLSTATHFMLKPYKEQGVLMTREQNEERLAVSP